MGRTKIKAFKRTGLAIIAIVISVVVVAGIFLGSIKHQKAYAQLPTTPYDPIPGLAMGDQKTAVIVLNYSNTDIAFDLNKINNDIFTLVSNFYKEQSYNKTFLSGKVYGTYKLSYGASCNFDKLILDAIKIADPDVDYSQIKHVVVIAPYTCGTTGYASTYLIDFTTDEGVVTMTRAFLKSTSSGGPGPDIAAHELGHNQGGVKHGGFMTCDATTLSCGSVNEYGDPYDVMGKIKMQHFSSLKKEKVGWFSDSQIQTIRQSGQYTIEPYETATDGLKSLKVWRGNETDGYLYIEYRRPIGFDAAMPSNVISGALLHIKWLRAASGGGNDTTLIDATPPTSSSTPALGVGQTFTDPKTGSIIKVVSRTDTALTVDVTLKGAAVNPPGPTNTPTPAVSTTPTPTPTNTSTPTPLACNTSSATFQNTSIPSQNGQFTLTFNATPNQANMDGVIGLSQSPATAYTNLAGIVRFNPNGVLDAMNGSAYAADASVPYAPGVSYTFRMVVNVPSHTYSVYVTPAGSSETLLANNYAFRAEQASVTSLGNIGYVSSIGSNTLCNPQVSDVSNPTPTPTSVPTATPTQSPTNGLQGTYYNNKDFTAPVFSRIDSTINFNWGSGSPSTAIGSDTFSIRWVGKVVPTATGTWTFYTDSDAGVRLWVNGTQLVNNWTAHTLKRNSGSLSLVQGQKYTIQIDYYENVNTAAMQLRWKGPGVSTTIVPSTQLWTN